MTKQEQHFFQEGRAKVKNNLGKKQGIRKGEHIQLVARSPKQVWVVLG